MSLDCSNLVTYPQADPNVTLLNLSIITDPALNFGAGGSELSKFCRDSLQVFNCMITQPQCANSSVIPMCRRTCEGQLHHRIRFILNEVHGLFDLFGKCIYRNDT